MCHTVEIKIMAMLVRYKQTDGTEYSLETNVVIYDKVYILYSSHILYSYTLKDIYYVQIRKGMGYSKIFNVQ